MSTLKQRLSESMKTAMKSGEKEVLAFCRNLHAAVRKKEIDDRIDLDDEGFLKIVQTQAKQRQDSMEQFRNGGREDLATQEEKELTFLKSFLPEQMSDSELESLVKQAVEESGASSPKDMGNVMKVLLPKIQGKADNKRVSETVRKMLP